MVDVAHQLSEALASLVDRVSASVVRVEGRRGPPSSGTVWADDVVVTSHHGIEDADRIEVALADGRVAAAALAGRDPATDLAVLRVQGGGLQPAPWAEADGLRVGHLVLAVGRPGRGPRASAGIVGALGDAWQTPAGGRVDRYVQTELGLYPGFSGSALADTRGQVVGVNSSGLRRGRALALPTSTVRRVAETLLAKGRMERGYLGVGTQAVRLPAALAGALGQESALLIASVQADGPAERAGVLLGDVLVSLDGRPVRQVGELFDLLAEEKVGATAPARVVRGGEVRDLRITIGARPWP